MMARALPERVCSPAAARVLSAQQRFFFLMKGKRTNERVGMEDILAGAVIAVVCTFFHSIMLSTSPFHPFFSKRETEIGVRARSIVYI